MADISKINPNGTEYNLKDATARAGIESSKTLKSSVVTVTDAAPINAEDITVDITPVQDLHGYDRPWAGGAWKNKLPMTVADIKSANTSGTWIGNTYTINNGTFEILVDSADNVVGIKVNGTFNAQSDFTLTPLIPLTEGDLLNGSTNGASKWGLGISGRGIKQSSGRDYAITSEDASVDRTIYIRVFNATSVSNQVFYPMIRLSTETDATFAPYTNICPIEGRTGAELDRDGANLWDNSDTEYGYLDPQGVVQAHSGFESLSYREISPGNPYTLSFYRSASVSDSGMRIAWYDADKQFIKRDGILESTGAGFKSTTATAPSNAKYARASICITNASDIKFYQGQQYTQSFGETVYGGKWHVTKGGTDKTYGYVVFDGSEDENWVAEGAPALVSGSLRFTYLGVLSAPRTPAATIPNMLVNELSIASGDATWSSVDNAVSISLSGTDICIRVAGIDTVAKLKEWLSNNPLQVCYELATPTTISTPKQNVPMLKGINTVSADCGDTSLKYQPDNVIGELKGEIQKANSFVERMALREGSGAKDFSYGGWSFRLYIYRSMGQISMSVERISASNVIEQAVIKTFNGESDYRAPEDLRPIFSLIQAATYTTPSGWAIQVYLTDDGYIMFTGMAPEVGASAPTSSNWNLVEPWATHQQAKDLFNN